MKRHITTAGVYEKTASGSSVPVGSTTEANSFSKFSVTSTYLDSTKMLQFFRSNGVDPSRSTSLMRLIAQTSDSGGIPGAQVSHEQIFASLQLRRIIDAVNAIADDPSLPRLLAELLDGTLDLLARGQSKAKDTLWEIELLRILRSNGISSGFGEPDLLLTVSADPVGVACKKLYSEANFSKVISRAVAQIQRSLNLGIVAVNLDDLMPENSILKAPTPDIAAKMLDKRIYTFMAEHERHLRKYIEPGRAIAVIVSCAVLADLDQNNPRFCNVRQTNAWHIPSISPQIDQQFSAILAAFQSRDAPS